LTAAHADLYNARLLQCEREVAMSESGVLTIHTDGGARGNPGPAAFAYVIQRDGGPAIEQAGCMGKATNNQAEYTALIRALEHAERIGTNHPLCIHSDSELLVKQMNGEYRVKDEGLKPLYEQARRLASRFGSVSISHIPRAKNTWADHLYNAALDGDKKKSGPSGSHKPKSNLKERETAIREEAVECLRTAASAWARGNAHDPKPELVWDQLWSVLEENGALRK
jgi:ribonuclease HI